MTARNLVLRMGCTSAILQPITFTEGKHHMSPVINLGSLPPDDPVYTGREATVFFRRKPSELDEASEPLTEAASESDPHPDNPQAETPDADAVNGEPSRT
jgi:hypothetical protein